MKHIDSFHQEITNQSREKGRDEKEFCLHFFSEVTICKCLMQADKELYGPNDSKAMKVTEQKQSNMKSEENIKKKAGLIFSRFSLGDVDVKR
jgi:hypothetical protein